MSPQQEIDHKLESIFSSVFDSLRNIWDVTTATNILVSLVFYKRLFSLEQEQVLDLVSMEQENLLHRAQSQLLTDKRLAVQNLSLALTEIAKQNPMLKDIFRPLTQALAEEQNMQPLVQVILTLENLDFSSQQLPEPIFGPFFNNALYQGALHAGRQGEQWLTPYGLNRLLAGLADPQPGQLVYDPAVGLGGTLLAFKQHCPEIRIMAEEKELNTWAWAKMNLLMNGVYEADLRQGDSLCEVSEEPLEADIAVSNFPFGLSVDTNKVRHEPYLNLPFEAKTAELEGNSLFVQRMLYQVGEKGKVLVILPLRSLYKDRQERRLREYLIMQDWLEAVITLPYGLLYARTSPICILIINKAKPALRQGKVLFINGSNLEVESKSKAYRSLSRVQIDSLIQAYRDYGLQEPEDSRLRDCVAVVPCERIAEQQYNLNARRYASPILRQLQRLCLEQPLLPLSEVFKQESPSVWVSQENLPERQIPFVRPQDLGASFAEYQLRTDSLESFAQQAPETEGRLLNESALLINRLGAEFRLSYFEYQGQALVVHPDLMCFMPDKERVHLEYLLLQLYSELFQQQLQTYKSDYEHPSVVEKEFVQLQILLPERKIQEDHTRETKVQLLREEERKVERLRHRLNMGKQQAQNEQHKIISSLQHELGNRLPAVLADVKDLRDYLYDKAQAKTPVRLDEPLFSEDWGEEDEAGEGDALYTVLQRMESMLRYAIGTIDAAGHIIKADRNRLQLEYVLLRDFFAEIQALYAHEKGFSIEVEIEQDEQGKELPLGTCLDKAQLSTAIVNLIENARRHGFTGSRRYLIRFRVGLSSDKKELIIEYKNDGKPFPPEFSFQDFISYGNYAGQSGHSGIGGYLIHQIVDNHDGHLYYREDIDRNDPFKLQFELTLPLRSC